MGLKSSCSYTTVKLARIHNMKLGIMHYSFMTAILVYIVVIKIVMQTGYIRSEDPIGTVQLSLQAPMGNCPHACKAADCQCDPDYPNKHDGFSPIASDPYCAATAAQVKDCGRPGGRCLCRKFDAESLVFPPTNTPPFLIATRITTWGEHRCSDASCDSVYSTNTKDSTSQAATNACAKKCPENKLYGGCNITDNCWDQQRYYTQDVEDFTVMISHNVQTSTLLGIEGTSADMKGTLKSCDSSCGNCQYLTPKPNTLFYESDQNEDVFTLGTLLKAAVFPDGKTCGVDLDATSNVDDYHSVRYNGVILIIMIKYKNFLPWIGQGNISYEYSVKVVKAAKSKVYQVVYNNTNLDQRRVFDRHGLKVAVLQTGALGQFNTTTLLLLLTSSLALLAAATTIVDALMLYVLPDKKVYRAEKYEEADRPVELRTSRSKSSPRAGRGSPSEYSVIDDNALLRGLN